MKQGVVTTQSGGLAGSTLTLFDGVKNIHRWLNLPFEQAWLMASLTPAKSLGIQDQFGTLEVGKYASMVAISSDFSIDKTWVKGRLVFDAVVSPC
ncbi:hypothetical protein P781_05230 [Vibrio mimicus CAIM 1883]|nr:hypothetical protein P780_05225 [Vibrio mimicus CAIM 1882]ERM61797.1 hypothetical protein P781_05230 [Vibrio mimicus CAIM 1883]